MKMERELWLYEIHIQISPSLPILASMHSPSFREKTDEPLERSGRAAVGADIARLHQIASATQN